MNYIELINNLWSLREQGLLTVYEGDLYLYLVHRCNRLGWKSSFTQPTDITCAVLGINRNALISRRNRLKQLGLINFKEGERKTKPPTYVLCNHQNTQTATPDVTPTSTQPVAQPHTDSSTITKNNTKLKKTNYENEREVDYQFVISTFNETCKSLPKVNKITDLRKQKIDAVACHVGMEKLFECFEIVEKSHFLSKRKAKWRATFDWIAEPDNMIKILEGNYSNESESSTKSISKHCGATDTEQYGAEKWADAAR